MMTIKACIYMVIIVVIIVSPKWSIGGDWKQNLRERETDIFCFLIISFLHMCEVSPFLQRAARDHK